MPECDGWVRQTLANRDSWPWVQEADIRDHFNNISHDWLLAHVPMARAILRKWLKAGYMEKQVLHATEEGPPQSVITSPVRANLALDDRERRLREKHPTRGKGSVNGRKAKVHLIRYYDDFIITGKTKELLEDEVKPLVESFLRERGRRHPSARLSIETLASIVLLAMPKLLPGTMARAASQWL